MSLDFCWEYILWIVESCSVDIAVLFVVAVVGMCVGYVACRLTAGLCERLGFDQAAEQNGSVAVLRRLGVQSVPSEVMSTIVFLFVTCAFVAVGAHMLGFEAVSDLISRFVHFIPRILLASIVLTVGLLLATFVRGTVVAAGQRASISGAEQFGSVCFCAVVCVVILASLEQLQIRMQWLGQAFLIAFAAMVLAVGLAFGLGCRDVIAGVVAGNYVRRQFQAGDLVTVAGLSGTVREVGMVATIIETDEDGLLKRRSVPNVRMLNEAVS